MRANHLARLCRMPPMRQQLCNLTSSLRRQPSQHILEIGIRIVPIITGRLDQTHDRSSALEHANPRRAFEKATG
ncbi:Phospholipase D/Transphosphatidylase [Escherichia coli P12b]|nr:Phospholipase D/Transphosphatidylase [Escherichia coli P12b]